MSKQRELRVLDLLLLPQGKQANTRDLHHLETYSRNITLSFAPTTEARDKYFIVLINEV